jgi:Flp pilus assembly protein TadG
MVFATPILLLLLLGTIDVGRLFFGYVDMTNAVREGAGYAAHRPAETEEIVRRVTRHADGLPAAAIQISCSNGSCASAVAGDRVTVSASWTFEPLTGAFLSAIFAMPRFDIQSRTTMKVL